MARLDPARIDGFRVTLLTAPGESDVAMWRDTTADGGDGGYHMDVFVAARIVGEAMDYLQELLEAETHG